MRNRLGLFVLAVVLVAGMAGAGMAEPVSGEERDAARQWTVAHLGGDVASVAGVAV